MDDAIKAKIDEISRAMAVVFKHSLFDPPSVTTQDKLVRCLMEHVQREMAESACFELQISPDGTRFKLTARAVGVLRSVYGPPFVDQWCPQGVVTLPLWPEGESTCPSIGDNGPAPVPLLEPAPRVRPQCPPSEEKPKVPVPRPKSRQLWQKH